MFSILWFHLTLMFEVVFTLDTFAEVWIWVRLFPAPLQRWSDFRLTWFYWSPFILRHHKRTSPHIFVVLLCAVRHLTSSVSYDVPWPSCYTCVVELMISSSTNTSWSSVNLSISTVPVQLNSNHLLDEVSGSVLQCTCRSTWNLSHYQRVLRTMFCFWLNGQCEILHKPTYKMHRRANIMPKTSLWKMQYKKTTA